MKNRQSAAKKAVARKSMDAVELLKADHRQVSQWFEKFHKARAASRKLQFATKICEALKAHTQIEEEIFYPAFISATQDIETHHEALVEHSSAKDLIGQILALGPADEYFDAKVKVLGEMIKHHVKEEEQPGGMFAKARKTNLDLKALGAQLRSRKQQLVQRI